MRNTYATEATLASDFEDVAQRLNSLGESCLSESEVRFLALMDFIPTVENGGLYTWFWNSTGDRARLTVNALSQIGATTSAATIQKVIDLFPASIINDENTRRQFMEHLDPALVDRIESLSDELFDNSEDVYALILHWWSDEG